MNQRAHNVLNILRKSKDPRKIILKPKRMVQTLRGKICQKNYQQKN